MIRKFLPYLKAHRWPVAWALAQVFLVAGFELLKPWPLQVVIDYVLGGKTPLADGPLGDALSLPALTLLKVPPGASSCCWLLSPQHFSTPLGCTQQVW